MFIASSLEEWLRDHLYKLKNKMFLNQKGNISYFMNVKAMQNEEFKNGSTIEYNGVDLSIQGKFEMLQSSIYPISYGVPCEYFFIIKVEFKGMPSLPCDVVLQRIHLDIKDKSRNRDTGKLEEIKVEINR